MWEYLKRKLKLPIRENYLMILYTQDICNDKDLQLLKNAFSGMNLDTEYLIVPSEYIKKIRFIKRKWKKD